MARPGTAAQGEPSSPGLIASLRGLAATFVAVLHSRAELVATELQRERARVTRLVIFAVLALVFLALATVTFTIFIVVLFWDSQRLVAIGFLTIVYLGIGIGLGLSAKREAAKSARPFEASLAELRKDRERFGS